MSNPNHPLPGSPRTLQDQKAAQAAAQREFERQRYEAAQAYAEVFGLDETKRSPAQKRVMADLRAVGCMDVTTAVSTTPQQLGPVDPYRTHVLEGRRQMFIHLQRTLDLAKEPPPA